MFTAKEAGLLRVAEAVRLLVPPQLEAVIIVYPPDRPAAIASVMATCSGNRDGLSQTAALSRGRDAAKAFIDQRPNNPAFNTQS